MKDRPAVSIVLPARNEARALEELLPRLLQTCPDAEILVVDDGSTDDTAAVCRRHGVEVLCRPYPLGNGAAVKAGARRARAPVIVFMDADGQHDPEAVPLLLKRLEEGYDMVVAARAPKDHAGYARRWANTFYNHLAGRLVGRRVADLTSGFRAVQASRFRRFLYLLPNGFSYPATITMAFFRSGYPVAYLSLPVRARIGTSHIRPLRDGLRFLLIILRVGTLYSPLKIFAPAGLGFLLAGVCYGAYTLFAAGRFTNMGTLLFSSGILVFLIGLVSEQVTALLYRHDEEQDSDPP